MRMMMSAVGLSLVALAPIYAKDVNLLPGLPQIGAAPRIPSKLEGSPHDRFQAIKTAVGTDGHPWDAFPKFGKRGTMTKFKYGLAKYWNNNYQSYGDFIRINELNYDSTNEKKVRAVKSANSLAYKLMKNKYPYKSTEGLEHFVFWSEQSMDLDKVRAIVKRELQCEDSDLVIWENPEDHKSVPDLWHAQVVFKKTFSLQRIRAEARHQIANRIPTGLVEYLEEVEISDDLLAHYRNAFENSPDQKVHLVHNGVRGYANVSAKQNADNILRNGFHPAAKDSFGGGVYTDIRVRDTIFEYGYDEDAGVVRFFACGGFAPKPMTWTFRKFMINTKNRAAKVGHGHLPKLHTPTFNKETGVLEHSDEGKHAGKKWMLFEKYNIMPLWFAVVPVEEYKKHCRDFWNDFDMRAVWGDESIPHIFPPETAGEEYTDFGLGPVVSYADEHLKANRVHDGVDNINFESHRFWNHNPVQMEGGRSGVDFLESRCQGFLIKGMNKYDITGVTYHNGQFIEQLVHEYTNNPNLLVPYYKIYKSLDGKQYWILMKYLHPDTDNTIVTEFDIKCSIGCRYQEDLSKTLKDNNFTAIFESIQFQNLEAANALFLTVGDTITFLYSQERFDYSLMVKVELGWSGSESSDSYEDSETPTKLRAIVKLRGVPQLQKATFHFMAVADCLNQWQKWPRSPESLFKKSFIKGGDRHEPSCKPPTHFANRLLGGMDYCLNKDRSLDSLTGYLEHFEADRPNYTQRIRESIDKYGIVDGVPAGVAWMKQMRCLPRTHAYTPTQELVRKRPRRRRRHRRERKQFPDSSQTAASCEMEEEPDTTSAWTLFSIVAALPLTLAILWKMAGTLAA